MPHDLFINILPSATVQLEELICSFSYTEEDKCVTFQQILDLGSTLSKGVSLTSVICAGLGRYVVVTILFFTELRSKAESVAVQPHPNKLT